MSKPITLQSLIAEARANCTTADNAGDETQSVFWADAQAWLQSHLDAAPKEQPPDGCPGHYEQVAPPASAIPPELAEALREWREDSMAWGVYPSPSDRVLAAAIDRWLPKEGM